jgi:hypothetical protein
MSSKDCQYRVEGISVRSGETSILTLHWLELPAIVSCSHPTLLGAAESFRRQKAKDASFGTPRSPRDGDLCVVNLNDVQSIRLAASARRCACAARYNQGCVVLDFVTRVQVAGRANMDMSRQKEIDAAYRDGLHPELGTTDCVIANNSLWEIERMMGDDDFDP